MKQKAPRKEGFQIHSYSFEFEGKTYKYSIQEPTFEQLAAALTESTKKSKVDFLAGGKVIWELCCIEHDEIIEKIISILVLVCTELFTEFVTPIDLEIKKN